MTRRITIDYRLKTIDQLCSLLDPATDEISFFRRHFRFIILGHCLVITTAAMILSLSFTISSGTSYFHAVGRGFVNIIGGFGRMTLQAALLDDGIDLGERNIAFAGPGFFGSRNQMQPPAK